MPVDVSTSGETWGLIIELMVLKRTLGLWECLCNMSMAQLLQHPNSIPIQINADAEIWIRMNKDNCIKYNLLKTTMLA